MKLHDVIRTRRQTLGLTQEELARRLVDPVEEQADILLRHILLKG